MQMFYQSGQGILGHVPSIGLCKILFSELFRYILKPLLIITFLARSSALVDISVAKISTSQLNRY